MSPVSTSRMRALRLGLCPRCRTGRIFGGLMRMNEQCGDCGLRFEREPGYFVGAMYVSYAMVLPVFCAVMAVLWIWVVPGWSLHGVLALVLAVFMPAVPLVFRYARILWIHLERAIDP